MLRFKNLFLSGANEAKRCLAKKHSARPNLCLKLGVQGLLRPRGLIGLNHGNLTKSVGSKIFDCDRLVHMKYLVADKVIDNASNSDPVIILHDMLDFKENWHPMALRLNEKLGRTVFSVDFRNHGASTHTYEFSYEFMVCDVILFMRRFEMKKATFIGHNMGGRVAMILAMRYPELVQSLVVVDGSPITPGPSMVALTRLLDDIKKLDLDHRLSLNEACKRATYQLLKRNHDDKVVNFVMTNIAPNTLWHTNWRWKFNLNPIRENFEKEILFFPIVSSPCLTRTLFLAGGTSDYLTHRHWGPIKEELFPNSEYDFVPGAGHFVHKDKPEDFLEVVVSFLEKDSPKAQKDVEKQPLDEPVELAFNKYEAHIDGNKITTPVIILHGLLGSKQNWHSLATLINHQAGREVYTLDARNHGDSPHTELFSYNLMTKDLLMFMKKHEISKATLIGHCMGGQVAMCMAMMNPSLVHSLVVVDISPRGPSASLQGVRHLLNYLKDLNLNPDMSIMEAHVQAAKGLRITIKDERIIAFILSSMREKSGTWRWKFNLDSLVKHFENEIATFPVNKPDVQTRTLFIGGADSDYIKPSDEWLIKNFFPKSELVFVEGAGHWVHAEKPVEFLKIVTKFLDEDH